MKINLEKWNTRRLAVEAEIRTLKTGIREGSDRPLDLWNPDTRKYEQKVAWVQPGFGTYKEYARLDLLKNEATCLYKVRAQYRGRQHQLLAVTYSPTGVKAVEALTKEGEREGIQGWMEEYALPAEVAQTGT